MTATIHKRNLLDAIVFEPIELIISQPHQALISSASVFLVAAEAGMLIEWPYNVLLGIGAEWAYLRGLSSGQSVQTRWATALNWSAVALVVLYGSLWGLRKFHAIPESPSVAGAVLLTLIHICCIGAVTLCSAMVHSTMLRAERQAAEQKAAEQADREKRIQDQRDEIDVEAARKAAELAAWEAGQRAALAIETERMRAKMQLKMQAQNARPKMQRNALPAQPNADEKICPKCGAALEHAQWLAARRWGHCNDCKEAS